ncbi:hypothetical protein [Leucobacter sp. G161]|uniref:hypothetical protein n=1 Tax=Leucobacter sp. G161 TaxID=663704 RepID=UPI00073BA456|nr:hypothetical protein [Leucobacter sp. G161]KUF05595.1 hypothetical protein AUL38_16400 [Leucobacter sp. G161]
MSEQTGATNTTEETNEQSKEASKEFTAITSQEDFDKAIQARIARERAKIPTDYEELQAKAAKLQEIEDAKKSDEQKAAERIAAAEKRASELESQVVRAEVAAAKNVPAELLSGSTKEELEASADALIAFRGEQPVQKLIIPNEGNSPQAAASMDDWLREAAK